MYVILAASWQDEGPVSADAYLWWWWLGLSLGYASRQARAQLAGSHYRQVGNSSKIIGDCSLLVSSCPSAHKKNQDAARSVFVLGVN